MVSKSMLIAILFLVACQGVEEKPSKKYMDLKGFFEQESARLSKARASVEKTVSRNGISERKKNMVPNWDAELNLFIESDINKPAWRDSYRIAGDSTIINYTAIDQKLRTRSIKIRKDRQGVLKDLIIVNRTQNSLYSSTEELRYSPDSIYRIVKKQDVILLGNNNYEISGIFK